MLYDLIFYSDINHIKTLLIKMHSINNSMTTILTTILGITNRVHIAKRAFLFPNLPKTEPKEPI